MSFEEQFSKVAAMTPDPKVAKAMAKLSKADLLALAERMATIVLDFPIPTQGDSEDEALCLYCGAQMLKKGEWTSKHKKKCGLQSIDTLSTELGAYIGSQ